MKLILFFSFFLSICYGVIWISLGLLLQNHFETVLSMILRKPVPENLINPHDYQKTKSVINVIGLVMVIIGIITMIIGLFTLITGFCAPVPNLNFRF